MQADLTSDGDVARCALSGHLDAGSGLALAAVATRLRDGPWRSVIFDLGGVQSMNSVGVRALRELLRSLPSDVDLVFVEVPALVVDYLNVVHGLFDPGRVESFRAPYYCARCAKESEILYTVQTVTTEQAPAAACGHCGGDLELAVEWADFTGFMGR